jgi:ArsR family transcriptional regulator
VLAEAARLVAPGGTVLVLDLLPHGETWVRERMGHRRQGVAAETLAAWLEAAGLGEVRVEPADRRRGDPFVVLIGSGRKPAESVVAPADPTGGAT